MIPQTNTEKTTMLPADVTPEVIASWKNQYAEIHRIKLKKTEQVDGKTVDTPKVCYLRMPERKEISFATSASQSDPLAFNKVLIDACWLAGDPEILTHTGLNMSLGSRLSDIIGIVEAELEKL